jgi:hypothetical protein
MALFKKLFGRKPPSQPDPDEFWLWFTSREKAIHKAIQSGTENAMQAMEEISDQLLKFFPGLFPLIGATKEGLSDFIITPDGIIKNVALAEDLVSIAPTLSNWKFQALKPQEKDFGTRMHSLELNEDTLFFATRITKGRPDAIQIEIVHRDVNETNLDHLSQASLIFLDSYLGELFFATSVDHAGAVLEKDASSPLRPIEELQEYIRQRQAAFAEKYAVVTSPITTDDFALLKGQDRDDEVITAMMSNGLLAWDAKASHPWLLKICVGKQKVKNLIGVQTHRPDRLDELEDRMLALLPASEGYLHIGHISTSEELEIVFACKEFRHASRVTRTMVTRESPEFEITFDIHLDKYWSYLDPFNKSNERAIH